MSLSYLLVTKGLHQLNELKSRPPKVSLLQVALTSFHFQLRGRVQG